MTRAIRRRAERERAVAAGNCRTCITRVAAKDRKNCSICLRRAARRAEIRRRKLGRDGKLRRLVREYFDALDLRNHELRVMPHVRRRSLTLTYPQQILIDAEHALREATR